MKKTLLTAALLIGMLPALAMADHRGGGFRYDRGGRYNHSSHSFFDFSIGFGGGRYNDFGFAGVGYRNYGRSYYYPAPYYYSPPVVYAPAPVVVYSEPAYIPPPAIVYQSGPAVAYPSSNYYCAPGATGYYTTGARYYYGR